MAKFDPSRKINNVSYTAEGSETPSAMPIVGRVGKCSTWPAELPTDAEIVADIEEWVTDTLGKTVGEGGTTSSSDNLPWSYFVLYGKSTPLISMDTIWQNSGTYYVKYVGESTPYYTGTFDIGVGIYAKIPAHTWNSDGFHIVYVYGDIAPYQPSSYRNEIVDSLVFARCYRYRNESGKRGVYGAVPALRAVYAPGPDYVYTSNFGYLMCMPNSGLNFIALPELPSFKFSSEPYSCLYVRHLVFAKNATPEINCGSLRDLESVTADELKFTGSATFRNCGLIEELPPIRFTSDVMSSDFDSCYNLKRLHFSYVNPGISSIYRYVNDCKQLEEIVVDNISDFASVNLSGSCNRAFFNAKKLRAIPFPKFDCQDKNVDLSQMFYGCESIASLPVFVNTSKVTNYSSFAVGCSSISTLPVLDFSSATTLDSTFSGCSSASGIYTVSAPKATSACNVFEKCGSGLHVSLNLPLVTRFDSAFTNSSAVIDSISLPNVTSCGRTFSDYKGTHIPAMDTSKLTYVYWMFGQSGYQIDMGVTSLGTETITGTSGEEIIPWVFNISIDMGLMKLNLASISHVMHNLKSGVSGQTFKLSGTSKGYLEAAAATDGTSANLWEQLSAEATAKGWTVTVNTAI